MLGLCTRSARTKDWAVCVFLNVKDETSLTSNVNAPLGLVIFECYKHYHPSAMTSPTQRLPNLGTIWWLLCNSCFFFALAEAKLIVVVTRSGHLARLVAKHRPSVPVRIPLAYTETCRKRLQLEFCPSVQDDYNDEYLGGFRNVFELSCRFLCFVTPHFRKRAQAVTCHSLDATYRSALEKHNRICIIRFCSQNTCSRKAVVYGLGRRKLAMSTSCIALHLVEDVKAPMHNQQTLFINREWIRSFDRCPPARPSSSGATKRT